MKHILRGLGLLVTFPTALVFLAAVGSLGLRIFFWARTGAWLRSVCDILGELQWNGDSSVIAICADRNTGWKGIDDLYHWLLWQADMTLTLVAILVTLFVVAVFLLLTAENIRPTLLEQMRQERDTRPNKS